MLQQLHAELLTDLTLQDSTVPQWPWALLVLCHIYNDELCAPAWLLL